MSDLSGLSELYAELGKWAFAEGARNLHEHPGLWTAETPDWKVEMNGHREDVDGLPFATFRLTHKRYVLVAMVDPAGGTILGGTPNTEAEMIELFRSAALSKSEEPRP